MEHNAIDTTNNCCMYLIFLECKNYFLLFVVILALFYSVYGHQDMDRLCDALLVF